MFSQGYNSPRRERVGVRGYGLSIGYSPSPCPEGERLSFALKAHDRRGDRMLGPRLAMNMVVGHQ